jgi:hypothetical protein
VPPEPKSIGAAIDELIAALEPLDATARMTAIRAACDHLAIKVEGVSALSGGLNAGGGGSSAIEHPTDIRTFKQQKAPSSANVTVALPDIVRQNNPAVAWRAALTHGSG